MDTIFVDAVSFFFFFLNYCSSIFLAFIQAVILVTAVNPELVKRPRHFPCGLFFQAATTMSCN